MLLCATEKGSGEPGRSWGERCCFGQIVQGNSLSCGRGWVFEGDKINGMVLALWELDHKLFQCKGPEVDMCLTPLRNRES